MSDNLQNAVVARIQSIENDEKYMREIFEGHAAGAALGIKDPNSAEGSQLGTAVPRYFGAIDTFVTNPSNVSIGILARMIETDPTIMSAVQFKSLMMLSKIGEYQHENDEIEEFVRDYLKAMDRPSWGKAKEGMSSHNGYGFSVSEIVFGLNRKNQKVPRAIKTYHPSTICFEVDQNGEVTPDGVIQFTLQNSSFANPNNYFPSSQYGFSVKNPFTTPNDRLLPYRLPYLNNYGLQRIPRNKVIHHTNNGILSFGSPYGKTPVRTAHLAWQMKVFVLKQMGIAAKRQASPFVHATAPMNQNKVKVKMPDGSVAELNPIDALTQVLAAREGSDSVVTGPETAGYAMQAIAAQIDQNQYLSVLNWLDTQMFRAFLLPSLVMTDGSAGSRALGDKHFQIVDRIAEEEAKGYAEEIVNQMIKRSIVENFGEQDDYGHFAQRPQSIEERERLANMFNGLAQNGFIQPLNKAQNDFVSSSLHLPQADESFYSMPMPNFDPLDGEDDGGSSDDGKPEKHKEDGGGDE